MSNNRVNAEGFLKRKWALPAVSVLATSIFVVVHMCNGDWEERPVLSTNVDGGDLTGSGAGQNGGGAQEAFEFTPTLAPSADLYLTPVPTSTVIVHRVPQIESEDDNPTAESTEGSPTRGGHEGTTLSPTNANLTTPSAETASAPTQPTLSTSTASVTPTLSRIQGTGQVPVTSSLIPTDAPQSPFVNCPPGTPLLTQQPRTPPTVVESGGTNSAPVTSHFVAKPAPGGPGIVQTITAATSGQPGTVSLPKGTQVNLNGGGLVVLGGGGCHGGGTGSRPGGSVSSGCPGNPCNCQQQPLIVWSQTSNGQPLWAAPSNPVDNPVVQPRAPKPPPATPHNTKFLQGCDPRQCVLNEEADFHSMGNEDESIYEIFYTNPIKCCRVVVEIGAGDGDRYSASRFFEEGLNWRSLLIEAHPEIYDQLVINRPNATTEHAAFCEADHILWDQGHFRAVGGSVEVTSESHQTPIAGSTSAVKVPCVSMVDVFEKHGITHVDLMVVRVQGDALAVIRSMDWRVRVDIWVVLMHGASRAERDELVRNVLSNNEYVQAEWDIKRWCSENGLCLNNEVFLRKGFNPLPPEVSRTLRGKRERGGASRLRKNLRST